jgi:hypothetical protein
LERIEYQVRLPDTFASDAKVLRDASGKVTGVESGASSQPTVTGGAAGVVEIKRMKSPWK